MKRSPLALLVLSALLFLLVFSTPRSAASAAEASQLLEQFQAYSGARLVFRRGDLPSGSYHDIMVPLSAERQQRAAAICLREVKKYPPGYLGEMGLEAIGVFAACASRRGDGYRPYNKELGGYRYYGIWNGDNGIAAAYYSDGQLPLTFHHEIFHHVDGTRAGVTDAARHFSSDDRRFQSAIDGRQRYAAPAIGSNDLNKLRRIREGYLLRGAVSDYSSKTSGEDQAETARHFLTSLADSLVQIVEQPELPGSQRILHCLSQYESAVAGGPAVDWFVNVALGRKPRAMLASRSVEEPLKSAEAISSDELTVEGIVRRLQSFASRGSTTWEGVAEREQQARDTLAAAAKLDASDLSSSQARQLVDAAADVTHQLLRYRLRAKGNSDATYAIWGGEDSSGVNWTLRRDLADFGSDAQRLKQISALSPQTAPAIATTQLRNLRLVARYYAFIASNWEVTGGTQRVFEATRDAFAESLPAAQSSLASTIADTDLDELARRLPADGTPKLLDPAAVPAPRPRSLVPPTNKYLANVRRNIADPDVRRAINQVQPACVRFDVASGVCISPDGAILTAAHVAKRLGRRLNVTFPDGKNYDAICTVYSEHFDLALMQIRGASDLPFAPLASSAPDVGTWVCAIGQPGSRTPDGEPTGYGPFHVSTGEIRGFKSDRLGRQMLGGTKHDAWTYWGHSGCPLFNRHGQIVAMHNSWDSTTAMRHAVTYEAIRFFLHKADVDFALAK